MLVIGKHFAEQGIEFAHFSPLSEATGYSYMGHPIVDIGYHMSVEVAKLSDLTVGKMKNVKAFNQDILISNVGGKIYATSNRCGHQNAPLAKGTLNGAIVTCPLHGATFDVRSGKSLSGPQLKMPPEMMQKLPEEMLAMFKRTGEILSEIEVMPLETYKVDLKGDSIYIQKVN